MPIGVVFLARGMRCHPPFSLGLALVVCLVVAGCAAPTMTQPPASETTYVANETTAQYTYSTNLEPNERPHGLWIRNDMSESVVVTVRIEREGDDVFDRAYELAPDAVITGNLTYEANYTVTVTHGNRVETVELPRLMFDCNISETTVTVAKWGLDSGTGSTLAYCPEDPPGDD